jgi:hypothetical protein
MTDQQPRGFRRALQALVAVAVTVFAAASPAAQVIDRILAVVDGSIITQSDVIGALRLGLVTPAAGADPVSSAVEKLIQRRLMLAEVERFAPKPPDETAVERRLEEIRTRAGSQPALDRILAETASSMDLLRRYVSDDLHIDAYLQQRFGAMFQQVSDEELLQYYKSHPSDFMRNGVARPFPDAMDDVRAAVVAARRAAQIKDWVEGLRRRASISVLL